MLGNEETKGGKNTHAAATGSTPTPHHLTDDDIPGPPPDAVLPREWKNRAIAISQLRPLEPLAGSAALSRPETAFFRFRIFAGTVECKFDAALKMKSLIGKLNAHVGSVNPKIDRSFVGQIVDREIREGPAARS
jgi:hypothetical protein